jgi:Cys-tRNA(Pro) deacylase
MAKKTPPVTAAIRVLRQHNIRFSEHLFDYEEHGGTAQGARELGVSEHLLVKTLIMEDEHRNPLMVLMHGDCEVSTKALARALGVKSVALCEPQVANRHSGYVIGGTSPFGTRRSMPVYMEASILELAVVYINGGKRGFLLGLEPSIVQQLLRPTLVKVAIPP